MLSDIQTIEEQPKNKVSNENTCEKPAEPHSSFDINPTTTTTQTTEEGENLLNLDLENFPMSTIENMFVLKIGRQWQNSSTQAIKKVDGSAFYQNKCFKILGQRY